MSTSTALAKIGSPKSALATVKLLVDRMREIQDQAFICSPFANLDALPEFFRVSERVVTIDPNPERGDVYYSKQFCKPGEVALTRPGLFKLWQAAGGTIISSRRTDDRSMLHYCAWEVVGEIRQVDGNSLRMFGSRTLDYRDGSEQIKGLTDGDVAQKRRAIQQLAETFATERMIRGCINLQQKYRAADLEQKPFVCYALIPDASQSDDPAIRRLAAAVAFGVVDKLYGAPAQVPGGQAAPMLTTESGDVVDPSTGQVISEAPAPDDDPIPATPIAPKQEAIHVCGCPCGDQKAVPTEKALERMKTIGCIRCSDCFPGRTFIDKGHLDLPNGGSLEIPGHPEITATWAINRRIELLKSGGR